MDRLDAMSVFIAIVDAGSFSEASRRLGMPLATVSRKVAELEAHLKTQLLKRPARKLMLTDAGRSYMAACKRIVEQVDEAERDASGEYRIPMGELVVTAPSPLGHMHLLPIALEFMAAFPAIHLRLLLSDRIVNLIDENIDVAIRIGELRDSSMIATRVGSIRNVVCASPRYLAAHGRPQKPEDLSEHECINIDSLPSNPRWEFTKGGDHIAVPVKSKMDVNSSEAAIFAAIAGVGITRVMSYKMEEARRAGQLEILLEEFEPTPWPVNILYTSRRLVPLKLRAFIDWAVPRLRARLGQPNGE
ncbi:LysR family transcriptional regulator [Hyphomicrobium sp.]|uniref:LysR family transcriptional regulator n=1 Tax=Hyphomicrobium sp. TaxID=82 RepID=UPI002D787B1E|nr:LysR family transcriptional regulator [Hyphomicrobium sp.]HET6391018.1 LysR family transcriptional regulator [Hyphomicrobium sp.]